MACWLFAFLVGVGLLASLHPMVQNVYRALRPSNQYDLEPPDLPELHDPAVLVFTKTNGFRHFDAIPAGTAALREIAGRRGWSLLHTENGAVFEAGILDRFQVVVWHNTSGAPLNDAQRRALRGWLESGGGFVGIHAALDDSHASWEWYVREIVGASFTGHPLEHQQATVLVEQPDHPAVQGSPGEWRHLDEWYAFDRSVRGQPGVEVLASVDESGYATRLKFLWVDRELAMGDHPVIWARPVGRGRALLCALGHRGELYQRSEFVGLLESAITWAGRLAEEPAPAEQ